MPIRIVLADDHTIFRQGFQLLLKQQKDIQLIGEAGDGNELLAIVDRERPDVVITDIDMPRLSGIEATQAIKHKYPDTGVIALSMHADEHLFVRMLDAGASGYLIKNTTKAEVFAAVKTVAKKESYYCTTTTNKLVRVLAEKQLHPPVGASGNVVLTEKEIEVIRRICAEDCNKEIAAQLHTTVRAVEGVRERIRLKVGAKNVVGIVLYAIRNGLFKLDR